MSAPRVRPAPLPPATRALICRQLADAVPPSRIPQLIAVLRPKSIDRDAPSWRQLDRAVSEAQDRQHDGLPLMRLIQEVVRSSLFGSIAHFDTHLKRINMRLVAFGYRVHQDGKVHRLAVPPDETWRRRLLRSASRRGRAGVDWVHLRLLDLVTYVGSSQARWDAAAASRRDARQAVEEAGLRARADAARAVEQREAAWQDGYSRQPAWKRELMLAERMREAAAAAQREQNALAAQNQRRAMMAMSMMYGMHQHHNGSQPPPPYQPPTYM